MAIQNRLTELLGIMHPVLLAPMDLVSGGRLAAAVSQAGGLGLLGGGYGDGNWIEREWDKAGNVKIGCGFITWSLRQATWSTRARTQSRTHGDHAFFWRPKSLRCLHSRGKLVGYLPNTNGRSGPSGDGSRGGCDYRAGHGSGWPRNVRTALHTIASSGRCLPNTPVVAAGGVADGRGLAAALVLGAEGVLMGTRFYASIEAEGHPEAKNRIVAAESGQTVRSIVFDLSRRNGLPGLYRPSPAQSPR